MLNFCIALLVYLGIGLLVALYDLVTRPKLDKSDEDSWNKEGLGQYMDFPKNPNLFVFCLISLVWPLHFIVKGKK
jgi:hypothetical protein